MPFLWTSKWGTWVFQRLVPLLLAFTRAVGETQLIHLWFKQDRKVLMLCLADTVLSLLTPAPISTPSLPTPTLLTPSPYPCPPLLHGE